MKEGYYRLTTEGDIEGKTTQTVGLFYGTPNEIITYAIDNKMDKGWHWSLENINVIDTRGIQSKVDVKIGTYNHVHWTMDEGYRERIKVQALSKLSDEEKEVLGLGC